jgi:hypothetical protein
MTLFHCLRFETLQTWRDRSPYLYPTETGWPNYTPTHCVPFSLPNTTSRATVEVFDSASTRAIIIHLAWYPTQGGPNRKHRFLPYQQYLDCRLLIRCRRILFTESLPNNERLLWLRYSDFQTSCYNIKRKEFVYTGLFLLGIGLSGALLRTRRWILRFHKQRKISRLAEGCELLREDSQFVQKFLMLKLFRLFYAEISDETSDWELKPSYENDVLKFSGSQGPSLTITDEEKPDSTATEKRLCWWSTGIRRGSY